MGQAFFLGLVQGLAEFLPVSSSGHLVLFRHIIGFEKISLAFDLLLHLATLLALLLFFRRDIIDAFCQRKKKTLQMIVMANIVFFSGCVFFKGLAEESYGSAPLSAILLIINGIFLLIAYYVSRKYHNAEQNIGLKAAAFIGFIQIFALLPGLSRSGTTIAMALLLGIGIREAFRFSFLMSIPAILGAAIYKLPDVLELGSLIDAPVMLAGLLTAFVTGLLALKILYVTLINRKIYIFGVYCVLAGAAALVWI